MNAVGGVIQIQTTRRQANRMTMATYGLRRTVERGVAEIAARYRMTWPTSV